MLVCEGDAVKPRGLCRQVHGSLKFGVPMNVGVGAIKFDIEVIRCAYSPVGDP